MAGGRRCKGSRELAVLVVAEVGFAAGERDATLAVVVMAVTIQRLGDGRRRAHGREEVVRVEFDLALDRLRLDLAIDDLLQSRRPNGGRGGRRGQY